MSPYQFENPIETVSYTKQELLDKIAEKKAAFESAGYSASVKGRALEIRTLLTLESWLKICFSDEKVNYSDSLLESFIDALSMGKASEMFAGHQMTPELLEKTKVFLHDGLKFALNDPTRKMPIKSLEDLGKAFQRTFNINSYEENQVDRKDDRRVISLIVRQLQQFEGVENQDFFSEAFYRYSEIIHLLETTPPDKKHAVLYRYPGPRERCPQTTPK